jgi:hypothetical protein
MNIVIEVVEIWGHPRTSPAKTTFTLEMSTGPRRQGVGNMTIREHLKQRTSLQLLPINIFYKTDDKIAIRYPYLDRTDSENPLPPLIRCYCLLSPHPDPSLYHLQTSSLHSSCNNNSLH